MKRKMIPVVPARYTQNIMRGDFLIPAATSLWHDYKMKA
jgi:hypothetical protein